MIKWYNSLIELQRVFAMVAIPSTVVLIVQTLLLLFGLGDSDADDIDMDGGDEGLALFSVRGIVAMLCVGGWSGIALIESGMDHIIAVLLAIVIGIAALVGMALLIKLLLKLQSSGNIDLANAIGKVGQVYIPIPSKMKGTGKINITIQDKYSEISAMTNDDENIRTGEMVRVVATDDVGMLVVERIYREEKESAPKPADTSEETYTVTADTPEPQTTATADTPEPQTTATVDTPEETHTATTDTNDNK